MAPQTVGIAQNVSEMAGHLLVPRLTAQHGFSNRSHHLHREPSRRERGLLRSLNLDADVISQLPIARRARRDGAQREMPAHPAYRGDRPDKTHAVEAGIHAMGRALDFYQVYT